jgi:CTP:molybdopterin cytidylyltransferase MocA
MVVAGLVLAAGAGTRYGGVKQLAPLRGRPLLEHAVGAMADAAVGPVVVVLGAHAAAVRAAAELGEATVVVCDDWAEGPSASLRAGVAAARDLGAQAVAVALGDQPLLAAAAVRRVVAAAAPDVDAVRATYDGVPGHPTLLMASTFAAVAGLRGDRGARDLLVGLRVRTVACDGLGAPADVDTPADLAALDALGA